MIIIASRNQHKVEEITRLEAAQGLELAAIANWPDCPDVLEDGVTCEENAAIKAVRTSLWLKREQGITAAVIGEDAGLAVEALLGWPGVISARIAPTNEERIALVLGKLDGQKNRAAYFIAQTALAIDGRLVWTWRGLAHGRIAETPSGEGGFGYDPIFIDGESGRTFAQLTPAEKNSRSHRTRAWTQALNYVRSERLQ